MEGKMEGVSLSNCNEVGLRNRWTDLSPLMPWFCLFDEAERRTGFDIGPIRIFFIMLADNFV